MSKYIVSKSTGVKSNGRVLFKYHVDGNRCLATAATFILAERYISIDKVSIDILREGVAAVERYKNATSSDSLIFPSVKEIDSIILEINNEITERYLLGESDER